MTLFPIPCQGAVNTKGDPGIPKNPGFETKKSPKNMGFLPQKHVPPSQNPSSWGSGHGVKELLGVLEKQKTLLSVPGWGEGPGRAWKPRTPGSGGATKVAGKGSRGGLGDPTPDSWVPCEGRGSWSFAENPGALRRPGTEGNCLSRAWKTQRSQVSKQETTSMDEKWW